MEHEGGASFDDFINKIGFINLSHEFEFKRFDRDIKRFGFKRFGEISKTGSLENHDFLRVKKVFDL